MFGISISSAILHFVIGGIALPLHRLWRESRRKNGWHYCDYAGSLPSAIIALAIDHRGELIQMSIHLSSGAIIGIISCIISVFITSIYINKRDYKKVRLHLFVG